MKVKNLYNKILGLAVITCAAASSSSNVFAASTILTIKDPSTSASICSLKNDGSGCEEYLDYDISSATVTFKKDLEGKDIWLYSGSIVGFGDSDFNFVFNIDHESTIGKITNSAEALSYTFSSTAYPVTITGGIKTVFGGDITFNGGTYKFSGGEGRGGYVDPWTEGTITVNDGATIVVDSTTRPLFDSSENLFIKGGTITGQAESFSDSDYTEISGGTINLKISGNEAIRTDHDEAKITGGNITFEGNGENEAISCFSKNLNINGGEFAIKNFKTGISAATVYGSSYSCAINFNGGITHFVNTPTAIKASLVYASPEGGIILNSNMGVVEKCVYGVKTSSSQTIPFGSFTIKEGGHKVDYYDSSSKFPACEEAAVIEEPAIENPKTADDIPFFIGTIITAILGFFGFSKGRTIIRHKQY